MRARTAQARLGPDTLCTACGGSSTLAVSQKRMAAVPLLQDQGLELLEGVQVTGVEQGWLTTGDGQRIAFDECLWCTQASAAPWLADTGLQLGDCSIACPTEPAPRCHAYPR